MRVILDEATDKWGIKVNRVELKNIMPPHDIQVTMEKQMRAERERREQYFKQKEISQHQYFKQKVKNNLQYLEQKLKKNR